MQLRVLAAFAISLAAGAAFAADARLSREEGAGPDFVPAAVSKAPILTENSIARS